MYEGKNYVIAKVLATLRCLNQQQLIIVGEKSPLA
jgi:hypothetical protein